MTRNIRNFAWEFAPLAFTVGVVVAGCAALWLILDYAYPGEQLTAGKKEVQRLCEGRATVYDVQGQNVLVYACEDGKLRTFDYGTLNVGRL